MKLNKEFLMKFISCFGPTSSKRGSSSMNAVAHPTHLSTIEEENHDSSISCAEGDLYCPVVNYDTKRVSGKKKKLNRSNTISSTSSGHHHHHHQQHYWRPSLSMISEDKTTIVTSMQSSVHRRSSSSPPPPPPPPSSGMMKKLLAGKKHGSCRRQRSTDNNECHSHNQYFEHHEPMMPAFSPAAFMF